MLQRSSSQSTDKPPLVFDPVLSTRFFFVTQLEELSMQLMQFRISVARKAALEIFQLQYPEHEPDTLEAKIQDLINIYADDLSIPFITNLDSLHFRPQDYEIWPLFSAKFPALITAYLTAETAIQYFLPAVKQAVLDIFADLNNTNILSKLAAMTEALAYFGVDENFHAQELLSLDPIVQNYRVLRLTSDKIKKPADISLLLSITLFVRLANQNYFDLRNMQLYSLGGGQALKILTLISPLYPALSYVVENGTRVPLVHLLLELAPAEIQNFIYNSKILNSFLVYYSPVEQQKLLIKLGRNYFRSIVSQPDDLLKLLMQHEPDQRIMFGNLIGVETLRVWMERLIQVQLIIDPTVPVHVIENAANFKNLLHLLSILPPSLRNQIQIGLSGENAGWHLLSLRFAFNYLPLALRHYLFSLVHSKYLNECPNSLSELSRITEGMQWSQVLIYIKHIKPINLKSIFTDPRDVYNFLQKYNSPNCSHDFFISTSARRLKNMLLPAASIYSIFALGQPAIGFFRRRLQRKFAHNGLFTLHFFESLENAQQILFVLSELIKNNFQLRLNSVSYYIILYKCDAPDLPKLVEHLDNLFYFNSSNAEDFLALLAHTEAEQTRTELLLEYFLPYVHLFGQGFLRIIVSSLDNLQAFVKLIPATSITTIIKLFTETPIENLFSDAAQLLVFLNGLEEMQGIELFNYFDDNWLDQIRQTATADQRRDLSHRRSIKNNYLQANKAIALLSQAITDYHTQHSSHDRQANDFTLWMNPPPVALHSVSNQNILTLQQKQIWIADSVEALANALSKTYGNWSARFNHVLSFSKFIEMLGTDIAISPTTLILAKTLKQIYEEFPQFIPENITHKTLAAHLSLLTPHELTMETDEFEDSFRLG